MIQGNLEQNLIIYVIFEGLISILTYRIDIGSQVYSEIYTRMKDLIKSGNENLYFSSHLPDKLYKDFYTMCRENDYSELSSLILGYNEKREILKNKTDIKNSLTFMPFEPNFLCNSRKFLNGIYHFEIKVKRRGSQGKAKLTPSTHEGYSETLSNVSIMKSESSVTLSGSPRKKRKR